MRINIYKIIKYRMFGLRFVPSYLVLPLLLTTIYILLVPSASAGTIIKSPAYLGLTQGLVICWTFDGTYTKVPDCSGNNNTGTITGATKLNGKVGQALSFDGINDSVGTDANISVPSAYSIALWFKAGPKTLGDKEALVSWDSRFLQLYGACGDGAVVLFYTTDDGCDGPRKEGLDDNRWHQAVVTFSGSTSSLYVDGSFIQSTTDTINTTAASFNVGVFLGAAFLDGSLDDVRLYNRALSANEIARLYKIGLGSTANRPTSALQNGLVGCWNFDGTYTKVPDCSGNNNTGTITGATKVNGKIGQALDLPSQTDLVDVGDIAALGNQSKLTWSFWLKQDSYQTGDCYISQSDPNNQTQLSWQICNEPNSWAGSSDDISVSIYPGLTNGSAGCFPQDADITLGQWMHVLVVFDGTLAGDDRIKVYTNGVQRTVTGQCSFTPPSSTTNSTNSVIIGDTFDGTKNIQAVIDDVRIYNRVLSANEIARLYKIGLGSTVNRPTSALTNGLVGCWSFDGAYVKVPDCSGNNNTGTITGATKLNGKVGQALSFDGVNNNVNVGDINSTDGTSLLTVSAWIKQDSLIADKSIVSKWSGINSTGWDIFVRAGDSNDIAAGIVNSINGSVFTTDNIHEANVWEHYVLVFDGTQTGNTNRAKLYKNGVRQVLSYGGTVPATTENTANVIRIGDGSDGNGTATFNGLIDEVRIYNRALSAGEVNKLYQMGR